MWRAYVAQGKAGCYIALKAHTKEMAVQWFN